MSHGAPNVLDKSLWFQHSKTFGYISRGTCLKHSLLICLFAANVTCKSDLSCPSRSVPLNTILKWVQENLIAQKWRIKWMVHLSGSSRKSQKGWGKSVISSPFLCSQIFLLTHSSSVQRGVNLCSQMQICTDVTLVSLHIYSSPKETQL